MWIVDIVCILYIFQYAIFWDRTPFNIYTRHTITNNKLETFSIILFVSFLHQNFVWMFYHFILVWPFDVMSRCFAPYATFDLEKHICIDKPHNDVSIRFNWKFAYPQDFISQFSLFPIWFTFSFTRSILCGMKATMSGKHCWFKLWNKTFRSVSHIMHKYTPNDCNEYTEFVWFVSGCNLCWVKKWMAPIQYVICNVYNVYDVNFHAAV